MLDHDVRSIIKRWPLRLVYISRDALSVLAGKGGFVLFLISYRHSTGANFGSLRVRSGVFHHMH